MSNNKFYHETIYRGVDLVKLLSSKKLTICGCGALGSNLIDSLVRQGFTQIKVIDKDRVETHNLNTQTFDESDVGALKVNAMQTRAFRAVGANLEIVSQELKESNVKKFLKDSSLVVDVFDNTKSRAIIQTHCRANKIPCIHAGMADGTYGEVAWDQVYKVPNDGGKDICDYPLTRNLVTMIVGITCEEIVDFCLSKTPRFGSYSFTLKDFAVRKYS